MISLKLSVIATKEAISQCQAAGAVGQDQEAISQCQAARAAGQEAISNFKEQSDEVPESQRRGLAFIIYLLAISYEPLTMSHHL